MTAPPVGHQPGAYPGPGVPGPAQNAAPVPVSPFAAGPHGAAAPPSGAGTGSGGQPGARSGGAQALSVLGMIGRALIWLLESITTVIYHVVWIGIGAIGVWLGMNGLPIGYAAPVVALIVLALYWTTGWMLFFE